MGNANLLWINGWPGRLQPLQPCAERARLAARRTRRAPGPRARRCMVCAPACNTRSRYGERAVRAVNVLLIGRKNSRALQGRDEPRGGAGARRPARGHPLRPRPWLLPHPRGRRRWPGPGGRREGGRGVSRSSGQLLAAGSTSFEGSEGRCITRVTTVHVFDARSKTPVGE
jgi:hypothetical protein